LGEYNNKNLLRLYRSFGGGIIFDLMGELPGSRNPNLLFLNMTFDCHTMRKLSVPYTINRRGVYYLNLRWNNQFIRQSLATKDPMEAFQKWPFFKAVMAYIHGS
jgi:hypothetical protein